MIDEATLDCLQVRGSSNPRFLDHDPHVLVSVVMENGGCITEYKINGTNNETVDVELAIGVDVEGAFVS
ncbi:hypothetical protein Q3G72_029210 [Acer saccharum]|nr:hypothetical protein Q3G72_029210 [Acer saccharum]